jgi:hypothetical protein
MDVQHVQDLKEMFVWHVNQDIFYKVMGVSIYKSNKLYHHKI